MLIMRAVVTAVLAIFFALGAVLILAAGPSAEWNSRVFAGFVVSAILTAPIVFAAGPIARRSSQSTVVQFYTKALIRLGAAILITQLGAFLVYVLDAGISPLLLGAGTGFVLLAFGVWPRRPAAHR